MAVYTVVLINIADQTKYEPYVAGWLGVWKKYKGEILAIDDQPTVVEGQWPFQRSVILSFPDEAAFNSWYRSPEYQELAEYRRSASTASMVLLKKFAMPDNLQGKQ